MDKLEDILKLLNESRQQQILNELLYKNEEKDNSRSESQDTTKPPKQSMSPSRRQDLDRKRRYEQDALNRRLKRIEERERQKKLEEEQQALHIQQVTCMDLPMDWDNMYQHDERTQGVHADSVPDGLIISLSNLGKVDIEYISSITGVDYKTVILTLKGSIFQNPETWGECFYQGWETAEEYLSGNLRQKWQIADEANRKYNGYFNDNIFAIKKLLPSEVSTKDIYITLGSPWVPTDVIDAFINHIL
jgi:hypothetical protein